MNAEQFGRLMAELQEIKALLAGKVEQEATAAVEAEPALCWWKSRATGYWWAGPQVDNFVSAVYCAASGEYFPGGRGKRMSIVSPSLPFAARVGVILGHAAANGIRIEPFPWHLINEEE